MEEAKIYKLEELNDYHKLIYPWQQHLDQEQQKNYYYNQFTGESLWALPEAIATKVTLFYENVREKEENANGRNVDSFVENVEQKIEEAQQVRAYDWMQRPARKQVETPVSDKHAYKQGDEIYNIWYDKFLSDDKFKEREQAPTRINVEIDVGYTKADLYQRNQGYFCIHFARGRCVEGSKCRYYHHIPTLEECLQIDQIKDIFGRGRYSAHRDDKEGVGNFMKETRTLRVSDFCLCVGATDVEAATYEVLWRHFALLGELEDIHLNTDSCIAFIRYSHRCMAEFAKEAMANQPLESNEIMIVRWSDTDIVGLGDSKPRQEEEAVSEEDTNPLNIKNGRMRKKKRPQQEEDPLKEEKEKIAKEESALMKRMIADKEYSIIEQRMEQIKRNAEHMDNVLKKLNIGEPVANRRGPRNYDDAIARLQSKAGNKSAQEEVDPSMNDAPLF